MINLRALLNTGTIPCVSDLVLSRRVVVHSQLCPARASVEVGAYDSTNPSHLGVCDTGRTFFRLRDVNCMEYVARGAPSVFSCGKAGRTYFSCVFDSDPGVKVDCIMKYDDDSDRYIVWW
jgi:hypothetical protein